MNTILVVDDRPDARYAPDALRRLTSDTMTSGIPVVHKTGVYNDPEHRRRGLEAGADEYLVEPIEPQTLVDTVKRLLSRRGS
jgi:two-component system NtrC family sensor kinase